MSNIVFSKEDKVYVNHTDAGGVVYHGNYLVFYENCRADWLAEFNDTIYAVIENGEEYYPVVSEANVRYLRPMVLGDIITVRIDTIEIVANRIIFEQSIVYQDGETILSTATITIACVKKVIDEHTGKERLKGTRIPESLVHRLQS